MGLGIARPRARRLRRVGRDPGASAAAHRARPRRRAPRPLAACEVIPEETAGPFPGDGTNGPDVLAERRRAQGHHGRFGTSTTVATGVPLTIRFAILDLAQACAPLAGAAVYAWQCDQQGRYSMYSQGVEGENYLRGVQAAATTGSSSSRACSRPATRAAGRTSTSRSTEPRGGDRRRNTIATSQIALPADIATRSTRPRLRGQRPDVQPAEPRERHGLREDGAEHQLGTMSGSVADGLVVELPVPVEA